MSAALKAQLAAANEVAEAKRTEAAQAWKTFDGLRTSATSEGVDFLKDQDAFDKLDTAGKTYDGLRDELAVIESKASRLRELAFEGAPAPTPEAKAKRDEMIADMSPGEAFTKSEIYGRVRDAVGISTKNRVDTEAIKVLTRDQVKTLLSVTVSGANALTGIPVKDRTDIFVPKPQPDLSILDLIPVSGTDSDVVEWVKETTWSDASAETAEGTAAGESTYDPDPVTTNVREITNSLPVTKRSFADIAFLEGVVNQRMIEGIRRRLQTQVLSGNGSGENLAGIYGTSGIGSIDRSTLSVNMLDGLHKCVTSIRLNAYSEPNFIGMNPTDWETVRLTRDDSGATAGTGGYLLGPANDAGIKQVWGVPVIVHAGFTSGSPLVGNANESQLWVREGVSLSASDSHADFFLKRQVALLATMRAAFAVLQPAAFAVCVA